MRARGEQWNRQDTRDEKSPNDGVAEPDGCQSTHDDAALGVECPMRETPNEEGNRRAAPTLAM